MVRRRLDAELVRRGLARSRGHAQELVEGGRVRVAGTRATKAATLVDAAAAVLVDAGDDGAEYVSRGGHKLAGALAAFAPGGLAVSGRDCLDAGASTGGFTDVLLRRGAARVVAVDVGYGQLAWPLRRDPRVVVLDRTNARALAPGDLPFVPSLVVGDLSFISLGLVLPALLSVVAPDGDVLPMVKPQFEVGRAAVGAGGVVRDPELRARAVRRIADVAWQAGWGTAGVVASAWPGPSGNVEYFLWLRRDAPAPSDADVARAVHEGPGAP